MSKSDCLEGNWQTAGYEDALAGNTTNRFSSHTKACAKHSVSANEPIYLQGHQQGAQQYCLPQNGIEVGSRNKDYRGICPVELESEFLQQYILGLQLAHKDLVIEYRQIDYKLDDVRYARAQMTEDKNKDKVNQRIDDLENKLDSLRTARHDIKRKIYRWRAKAQST